MDGLDNKWNSYADMSLRGEVLSREQGLDILSVKPSQLIFLVAAAFRVREHYFGNKVHIHVLQNAKMGACPEDCGFCSQSSKGKLFIKLLPISAPHKIGLQPRKLRLHF